MIDQIVTAEPEPVKPSIVAVALDAEKAAWNAYVATPGEVWQDAKWNAFLAWKAADANLKAARAAQEVRRVQL